MVSTRSSSTAPPLSENTTISANGEQATLFRDLGTITMHLNSIERIELAPLGGADNTIVNDLAGTSVKEVAIDLGVSGGVGDGQTDSVTVNGTGSENHINVTASGTMLTVSGLSEQVTIDHGERPISSWSMAAAATIRSTRPLCQLQRWLSLSTAVRAMTSLSAGAAQTV
jgi:hypothetical protein